MFRPRDVTLRWLIALIERFREDGAIDLGNAMTLEELGLTIRFKEAMDKHSIQFEIFSEVNGKYYLSEEKAKKFMDKKIDQKEGGSRLKKILTLRLSKVIIFVLLITVLIVNLLSNSMEIKTVSGIFLAVLLIISIIQLYYVNKDKRKVL